MTDRRLLYCLIVFSGVFALAGGAAADQVTLKNGDRLSGRILTLDDESVIIETKYAGKIRIPRNAVASAATEDAAGMESAKAEAAAPPAKVAASQAPAAKPPGGVKRKGRINLAGNFQRGNTVTDRIYGDGEFTERAADYRYTLSGKFNRAKEGDVKTASSVLGQANYDRFLDADTFWYLRGSGERDRFKDVALRTTAGGGYGLQLLDTERTDLSVRAGPDLVTVNRFQGKNETFPALGWGIKLSHWVIPERAEFFHDQDGFWNLDETGELTLRTRTGVRVPLTNSLNASMQVNLDWEKQPTPGSKSTDTTWLLGLGYTW